MGKRILTTTIATVFAMVILLPTFAVQAQADKLGWVGPVYKELSARVSKRTIRRPMVRM